MPLSKFFKLKICIYKIKIEIVMWPLRFHSTFENSHVIFSNSKKVNRKNGHVTASMLFNLKKREPLSIDIDYNTWNILNILVIYLFQDIYYSSDFLMKYLFLLLPLLSINRCLRSLLTILSYLWWCELILLLFLLLSNVDISQPSRHLLSFSFFHLFFF